jgi:hypothetical protein
MLSRMCVVAALVTIVAAGLLGSGCAPGSGKEIVVEGPVTIDRVFEEGAQFRYRFRVDNQSGVKRTAYEQTIYSQTELKTTNTVNSASADAVEMSMRFDYAVGSVTISDQVTPDETVASLGGKQLDFSLTPEGDVVAWTGLSGEDYLEAGAGQMAMLLYDVFPPLPDGPVEIGTTWETDYDIPDITSAVNRDFVGETKYTVVAFKEKYEIPCIEIKRVTTFEFEGRAEQAGEVWLMSGAGDIEGTLLVSIERGNVVYGVNEASLTLQGEGASVASAAASNVVQMGIKSRLTIDLL